jgi:nitrogen regulatory protein PII
MLDVDRKLLTIITESVLETELCKLLESLDASGYTVTNARGSGSRGVRSASWSESSNLRIEVVCSQELADRITKTVSDKYYDDYAMIIFESDVRVLRSKKFS